MKIFCDQSSQSMRPGQDQTHDPWISNQTHYLLYYEAWLTGELKLCKQANSILILLEPHVKRAITCHITRVGLQCLPI